jgi:hypothetical protein
MSAKRMTKSILPKQLQLSKARLDDLIDDALTDANGESEQVTGFYTMLENDLHLPFETQILGVTATVESIDITEADQLVAVCRAGKTRQRISLSELPLPSPPPAGAEWIAAYRYWRTGAMR